MHVAKSRVDKPGGMKFKVAAKPQRRSVAPSDVSKSFSSPRETEAPSEAEFVSGRSQSLGPRTDNGVIPPISPSSALPTDSTPSTSSIVASRPVRQAQQKQPANDMQSDRRIMTGSIQPPTGFPKDGTVPSPTAMRPTHSKHNMASESAAGDDRSPIDDGSRIHPVDAGASEQAGARKRSRTRRQSPSNTSPTSEQIGPSKRSRRGVATTERVSKSVEEVAAEDREAEEREPPDPTKITMSQLIHHVSIGRSAPGRLEKVQKLEESRCRDREIRAALRHKDRRITMGLPKDSDDDVPKNPGIIASPPGPSRATRNGSPEPGLGGDDDMDFINNLPGLAIVPRMMMDEHGRISVDERSITYARPDVIPDESMRHITERESDRFVNSLSHSRKNKGGQRWSKFETAEFYHWLSMFYMDFESIARVMPGRTRAEIKRKFKAEDKKNPQLIDMYLKNQVPIDLDAYSRITGKDITGPVPVVSTLQKLAVSSLPSTAEGEVEPSENPQEGSEDVGTENHMDEDEIPSV